MECSKQTPQGIYELILAFPARHRGKELLSRYEQVAVSVDLSKEVANQLFLVLLLRERIAWRPIWRIIVFTAAGIACGGSEPLMSSIGPGSDCRRQLCSW